MIPFRQKGFTLIELLIVVAIIAILAAIAVPNFLEAQVRAKVSRGKADMRSIATSMEAYAIDYNQYPPDTIYYGATFGIGVPEPPLLPLYVLTTPVAFMTSIPDNVFPDIPAPPFQPPANAFAYRYFAKVGWLNLQFFDTPLGNGRPYPVGLWALVSHGPDRISNSGEWLFFGEDFYDTVMPGFGRAPGAIYDPTNGTISNGDIIRIGP